LRHVPLRAGLPLVQQQVLLAPAYEEAVLGHLRQQAADHRSRAADHLCQVLMREFGNQDRSARVFDASPLGKLAQDDFQAFGEGQIQQHREAAQML